MLSPLSVSAIMLALSVASPPPPPQHPCCPPVVSQNKPSFLMLLWSGHSPRTAEKELVGMTSLLDENSRVSVKEALDLDAVVLSCSDQVCAGQR